MKILTPQRPLSLLPVLAALVPLPAWAGEAPEPDERYREHLFGNARQLAISGATQLRLDHNWASLGPGSSQSTMFMASGAVDYFVFRGLSLGARVGYDHFDEPGYPSSNSLSAGPRIGYDIGIARHWSLWPEVYGAYDTTWGGNLGPAHDLAVGLYVPVLYHPAPHLFVGLGPEATTSAPLNQTAPESFTTVGLSASVGGWIGI